MSTRAISGYFGGTIAAPNALSRIDIEAADVSSVATQPLITLTVSDGTINATTGAWSTTVYDSNYTGVGVRIRETIGGSPLRCTDYTIPAGSTTLDVATLTPGASSVSPSEILAARQRSATGSIAYETLRDRLDASLHINVKEFGAAGDGVTDDTAAIQAAMNACYYAGMATPTTVFFPSGIYRITDSLVWRTQTVLQGSGTEHANSADTAWGGTTILLAKDVNKPAIFADTYIHAARIMGIRILQESGSTVDVTGAHGIHIAGGTAISGFGELSLIDDIQIKDMGGDAIRFGGGSESTPIRIGFVSLIGNAGNGLALISENYGQIVVDHLCGDNNGNALLYVQNITSQGSVHIRDIKGERYYFNVAQQLGAGHGNHLIELVDCTNASIIIDSIRFSNSVSCSANSALIRHRSTSGPTLTNPGPNLKVGNIVVFSTGGASGYTYGFLDENIFNGGIQYAFTNTNFLYKRVESCGLVMSANGWNTRSAPIQFRNVKDEYFTLGFGDNHTISGLNFNHASDGATRGGVSFWNGGTTETARVDANGVVWSKQGLIKLGASTFTGANRVIQDGSGSPNSTVSAPPGSVYLRNDGEASVLNPVYIKVSGTGSTGWRPLQIVWAGTTANRPTGALVDTGFMYFDTTLHKPIWWEGAASAWKDATGATV